MKDNTIIDIHCHMAGTGYGGSGCFVSARLRRSWRYGAYMRAYRVTENELIRYGDTALLGRLSLSLAGSRHVGSAVVLALDGVIGPSGDLDCNMTELYVPDEFLAGAVGRFGNLRFGASVNPGRKDALDRLHWASEKGAALVKWLPPVQGIDPADKRHVPFYRKLAELKLPLLTHTGSEHAFTTAELSLADPERLRLPLENGVTVIAAHCAASGIGYGLRDMERLIGMFREYPGLHADISSLTQINKVGRLARLLKRKDAHSRLMYGSDMPLIRTPLVSPLYFPGRLSPGRMFALSRISNPWDRDVMLKRELGTPECVFANAARVLSINSDEGGLADA